MQTTRFILTAVLNGLLFAPLLNAQDNQTPVQAPTPGAAHNNVRPAIRWKEFQYACEGGAKVSVYLKDTLAKVIFQGHQYLMKQTRSADGNRYSDGKVLWWGKGEGGFLQEDTPDGNGNTLATGCQLNKPTDGRTGTISGTISYMLRIALPPSSVIQVQLLDMTSADTATDMPPPIIAEQNIPLGERQVPVPFELHFNPSKVDPQGSYALKASITVGDDIRFLMDKPQPVHIQGKLSSIELTLQPAHK